MAASKTRIEHDLLGDLAVPADAYYGVQTARALENFQISGVPISLYPNFIKALAMVKLAAARANADVGTLPAEILKGIEAACQEIIDGKLHEQFSLDVFQGGAGTSTNMNANEVIANIALQAMGHEKGRYDILHPNDHVNASQSTNDVYPTAVRLALWIGIDGLLCFWSARTVGARRLRRQCRMRGRLCAEFITPQKHHLTLLCVTR